MVGQAFGDGGAGVGGMRATVGAVAMAAASVAVALWQGQVRGVGGKMAAEPAPPAIAEDGGCGRGREVAIEGDRRRGIFLHGLVTIYLGQAATRLG